jgi:hypothetical protein
VEGYSRLMNTNLADPVQVEIVDLGPRLGMRKPARDPLVHAVQFDRRDSPPCTQ